MNLLDRAIASIAPGWALSRAKTRYSLAAVSRAYDAAGGGRGSGNWWRPMTTAAQEVGRADAKIAAAAQDLCRNSPLAHRAKMIWASNIVGSGIRAEINTKGKNTQIKANEAWDDWAESTFCDFDGQYNLYGLQWLWAATIVECGGVIIRKHVDTDGANAMATGTIPLRLQTFEQTMLDKSVTTPNLSGNKVHLGIEYKPDGTKYGYWIKNVDPETGDYVTENAIFLQKDVDAVHIFRKERPGQPLGVSWLAQSASTMEKYELLMDAKLMQEQVAACTGVFVMGAEKALGNKTDNEYVDELEPAAVNYLPEDAKVQTVTPPHSEGSQAFIDTIRADMAIGAGLASTQITGDYSKLNFASGRMSKIEFFMTLDFCQMQMMGPGLNVIFGWFKALYSLTSRSSIKGMGVSWTYPPRGYVQPKEELDTLVKKIRCGFDSPSAGAKAFGKNLTKVVAQWKIDKASFGDLPFDIDPSKFSEAGNQLNTDDAASSNVASTDSGTSGKNSGE